MGHLPRSSVVSLLSLLFPMAGVLCYVVRLIHPQGLFFLLLALLTAIPVKPPFWSVPEIVRASGSHVSGFPTVPTQGVRCVKSFRSRLVSLTSPPRALVPSFGHPDLCCRLLFSQLWERPQIFLGEYSMELRNIFLTFGQCARVSRGHHTPHHTIRQGSEKGIPSLLFG